MIKVKEFEEDLHNIAVFARSSYARKVYEKWRPYIDKRYVRKPEQVRK